MVYIFCNEKKRLFVMFWCKTGVGVVLHYGSSFGKLMGILHYNLGFSHHLDGCVHKINFIKIRDGDLGTTAWLSSEAEMERL